MIERRHVFSSLIPHVEFGIRKIAACLPCGRISQRVVYLLIAPLTLTACAAAGNVTSTGVAGTFEVSATATGGSLAWTRAHDCAMTAAQQYCEQRGMRASISDELINGVAALQQHTSDIRFECHQTL